MRSSATSTGRAATRTSPSNGPSISGTRKTAAPMAHAQAAQVQTTVALRGAFRPKLAKIRAPTYLAG